MLVALEASGESDAGFARRHGIGLHRIGYWRRKLRGDAVARFMPVRPVQADRPADESSSDGNERRVELALPNGARLRFVGSWDAASLTPWLCAVEAAS